jgi:hypothetical protein
MCLAHVLLVKAHDPAPVESPVEALHVQAGRRTDVTISVAAAARPARDATFMQNDSLAARPL